MAAGDGCRAAGYDRGRSNLASREPGEAGARPFGQTRFDLGGAPSIFLGLLAEVVLGPGRLPRDGPVRHPPGLDEVIDDLRVRQDRVGPQALRDRREVVEQVGVSTV